ncbi:MAG: L,D-transpeptidase family protein [Flavobacteriales bacterium]|nr:L,D-transpeptidase family protein [Flavobacteriales bacterium]
MSFRASFFPALLIGWFSCGNVAPGKELQAPENSVVAVAKERVPLAQVLDSLKVDPQKIWFLVMKSKRAFKVMVDSTELRVYPCVLGEQPVGDKRMQGDKRTPEGTFTFRSKRRPHKWHVFIHIDYPNAESRRRFADRKASGEIPANAAIGGEVGIHGVPDGMDEWITTGQDWTFGCIALKNTDVDEIYPLITPWETTLVIRP